MSNADVNLQRPTPFVPKASLSQNRLAKAHASADPRFNVKQIDRAGVSRGRGAYAQAGIQAANNLASGLADAYGQQLQDASTYADADLRINKNQEQYSQALAGLMSQATNSARMDELQRRGLLYGLMGDILG